MAYFALNTALLSITVVAYFVVQFRSIKVDRITSGILFLAFLCMIAFRPDTVGDTLPYMDLFASMDSYTFTLGLGRVFVGTGGSMYMEIGFANLCKLTSLISSSYQFFFFVVAFLNVGVGVFSIMLISSSMHEGPKVEYRILPVFLLFISYYGFWYSGILLRGGLAISFCMLSYAMIFRKRYILALLAYLVAFSFHNSALIFLVVIATYLFFPTGKIKTYRIAAIAIIVLYVVRFFDLFQILAIQGAQAVANHVSFLRFFQSYVDNSSFRSDGFLKTVLFFMLEFLFLTFCFTDNISKKQKKNLNVIMVLSIIGGLLGVFTQINRIIDILFVAVLPSLYSLLIEVPSDERFHIGKTLSIRKFPVILSSLAVIAFANLVLYSLVAELLWPLIALLLGK